MIDAGKRSVLGVLVNIIDYDAAVQTIETAVLNRSALSVSALAVHGVMTGVLDREQRYRLNQFDLITPDGQPVRWALNLLHHAGLRNRVYGPDLALKVCQLAERKGYSLYLYGSSAPVLAQLQANLRQQLPDLQIVGAEPSLFRQLIPDEKSALIERIKQSQADIVFVGLGCPRQEVWAYEFRDALQKPILAVGAAFDFLAGNKPQAPSWMQRYGLEWLFRLVYEPRRLWRRYLLLNPAYLALLALQKLGLHRFDTQGTQPLSDLLYG